MKIRKFRNWHDETKANLIRFWAVGAVYFFIGFGTRLGESGLYFDLVFFLAIGIAIMNMVVVNPIIRGMLRTSLNYGYLDSTVLQKVRNRLVEFFVSLFIVILILVTYQVINMSIIALFDLSETSIPIAPEPILFGVFYVIYYTLMRRLKENIKLAKNSK